MDGQLGFAVKYPFTEQARQFMEHVKLDDRVCELAVERIKKALKGDTSFRISTDDEDKRFSIASFAAARMILGTLRNNYVTSRFALVEAKCARNQLDHEDEETVDIIGARFGMYFAPAGDANDSNGLFLIDIPTYLRYSPRSTEYRLINRRIMPGKVEVKKAEKRRLIEEAIRKHIENIPLVKDVPAAIEEAGKKIVAELPKQAAPIELANIKDHPPCVARLLESASKHENLNHQARFYLATYLIAIGMKDEQIVQIYSTMPDFSEKTTEYQVAHIRKKGYSVPACALIMTYGLCCAVCKIGSPINWHKLDPRRKEEILGWKKQKEEK